MINATSLFKSAHITKILNLQLTVIQHTLNCTLMPRLNQQDTLTTDTQKELPNMIEGGTSLVNQSPCAIIHPDNDDTVILVQSPTPCTQYSHTHTHHATMHLVRIVLSRRPFLLANNISTDHHILNIPPQDYRELKMNYMCSQTPRPSGKSHYISPAY